MRGKNVTCQRKNSVGQGAEGGRLLPEDIRRTTEERARHTAGERKTKYKRPGTWRKVSSHLCVMVGALAGTQGQLLEDIIRIKSSVLMSQP